MAKQKTLKRPVAKKGKAAKSTKAGQKSNKKALTKARSAKSAKGAKATPKTKTSKVKASETKPGKVKPGKVKSKTPKRNKMKTGTAKTATPKAVQKAPVQTIQKETIKMAKAQTSKAKPAKTAAPETLIGQPLSGLSLPMTGGQDFDLSRYAGKKVVLYFYPKDMTPGCTQEGHDFTDLVKEFEKVNAVVLGISKDPVDKHEKFIAKENYKIQLVSDINETACKLFDVIKEKNMYGKKVMGIERSTFLIGVDGKVEQVWRKVKVEGHAQAVLDYIKAHQ